LVYNVSSKETKSLVCELHANTTKKTTNVIATYNDWLNISSISVAATFVYFCFLCVFFNWSFFFLTKKRANANLHIYIFLVCKIQALLLACTKGKEKKKQKKKKLKKKQKRKKETNFAQSMLFWLSEAGS